MWLASELAVFARTVELGSFTAAAKSLGVPKVAVSRAIAGLEKRARVQLLTRTTRRITLTAAGRAILPYAQRIVAEVDAARLALAPLGSQRSDLRLLAESAWGRLILTPLVPRFLERYPRIPLTVEMSADLPAEPGEQWDVLLQTGAPRAEGLVATRLGAPPMLLCATPGYLKANPPPASPAELSGHAVLMAAHAADALRLQRGRQAAQVSVTPKLLISDPAVVHAATAAGAGIGVLPEFLCRQGLAMAKLQTVLPEWEVHSTLELYAVTDLRRSSLPAVQSLIEFLSANMVPVLGGAPGSRNPRSPSVNRP